MRKKKELISCVRIFAEHLDLSKQEYSIEKERKKKIKNYKKVS